jgi:hypothetical protein
LCSRKAFAKVGDDVTGWRRALLLRLGAIFTVTGIIILVVVGHQHRLPAGVSVALGAGLVVTGLPMLVAGVYASLRRGKRANPP